MMSVLALLVTCWHTSHERHVQHAAGRSWHNGEMHFFKHTQMKRTDKSRITRACAVVKMFLYLCMFLLCLSRFPSHACNGGHMPACCLCRWVHFYVDCWWVSLYSCCCSTSNDLGWSSAVWWRSQNIAQFWEISWNLKKNILVHLLPQKFVQFISPQLFSAHNMPCLGILRAWMTMQMPRGSC